jgi:hypothetical protein
MKKVDYKIRLSCNSKEYTEIYAFLAPKTVTSEIDWGFGFSYKGWVFYLDENSEKAVRISPRKLFGLVKRRIELTDKVDQEIINGIKNIIENK